MTSNTVHGATPKQMSYIAMLLQRKEGRDTISAGISAKYGLSQREAKGNMTKAEASALIDQLKS
jgi:hypothetical protein